MSIQAFHHELDILESGGTHGNSATAALGRPSLENWELFTRETLQNSWDARDTLSDEDGVTFSIDYRVLKSHRIQAIREFFDYGTNGLENLHKYLYGAVDALPTLMVSDTGTTGLQGPTSASVEYAGRDDFVAFVRNIGRRAEKELRGGTYGFGKGVFFTISEAETVLVYTRTYDEHGSPVSRFIAMANSNGYSSGGRNYTGRHWWGQRAVGSRQNVFVDPFVGTDADSLARTFLMDEHFSENRPTGTTVCVLNPQIDSDEIDQVMNTIAQSLTRWAWPHMVETNHDMDPIDFSVTIEGRALDIPDPKRDPLLRPFVSSYERALKEPEHLEPSDFVTTFQRAGMHRWVDIVADRSKEYLGRLVVRDFSSERISHNSVLPEDHEHHIALMRSPRMVVKYWRGPKPPSDEGYAGVFLVAEHLDGIFADSEPPAHDEWNPTTVNLKDERFYLPGSNKPRSANPVNLALTRLKEKLRTDTVTTSNEASSESSSALQGISSALGSIVPTMSGRGLRVTRPKPVSKRLPSVPHNNGVKTQISLSRLELSHKGTVAIFDVVVGAESKALDKGVEISVNTAVIVDGKRVNEANDGLEMPKPLGWIPSYEKNIDWNVIAERSFNEEDLFRKMRDSTWEGQIAFLQPPETAIIADVVVRFSQLEKESE